MRGRHLAVALAVAALALAVTLAPAQPSAHGAPGAPAARGAAAPAAASGCGQGSWTAGSVDLCGGELVYRDYVYDAYGAAVLPGSLPPNLLGGPGFSSFPTFDALGGLPPSGSHRDQDQTDLVALRLRVDGGQVHVSAELNTLLVPGRATVTVAIDTDANAATGGGAWPGLTANPALALPLTSAGWDEQHALTGGDPATNLLTTSFPQPAGTRWRLWAVVADAGGVVANVAFRGLDERGFWWEDHQAQALAAGDITAMAATVDVADLTGGVTRAQDVPQGAVRQRVYVSRYPIGEGISDAGVPGPGYAPGPGAAVSQAFTFLGKYQPYGYYEPPGPGPHGLELLLHGLAENHSARLFFPTAPDHRITSVVGDARDRILAAPLGRGWKGWYSSYSERDVLDVLGDVEANRPVDAERVVLSGYSMGGYGTMRIAALHPDLFAGAINWVGYTGDFVAGTPLEGRSGSSGTGADVNAVDLLASLRHVPMASLYSGADELVLVPGALEVRDALAAAGVPSITYLHPAADHLTYMLLDDWRKESTYSAPFRLVHDPAHVTFRTDRRTFHPELDLVADRAYWVSAIVPAADGYADVDAVTSGCGEGDPTTATRQSTGLDPVPWEAQEVHVTGSTPRPKANRLDLTVRNVRSLRIDGGDATRKGACLDAGDLAYRVTTDGPTAVALADGRTLSFPGAGTFDGTLTAAGEQLAVAPGAPGAPPGATLPATGGGAAWPALAVAAVALVARRARRVATGP